MQFLRSQKLVLARAVLTIIAIAVVALIQSKILEIGLIANLELIIRDTAQSFLARAKPDQNVSLVDIDESSIEQIGPWPWPREQIAQLTRGILSLGARIVVLDIVLPSPRDQEGDRQLNKLASEKKLVLAQVFDYVERDWPVASGSPSGMSRQSSGNPRAIPATGIIANHAGLREAPCIGNIGFIPDPDGKLRSIPLWTRWKQDLYPSLALATLQCLGYPINLQGNDNGTHRLAYQKLPESWRIVSARNLLETSHRINPDGRFNNQIVLVGSSALGLSDRVATPLAPSVSGMVVHATALSELIEGQSTTPAGGWFHLAGIVLTLITAIVLSLTIPTMMQMGIVALIMGLWVMLIMFGASRPTDAHLTAPLWGILILGITLVPLQWSIAKTQARAVANLLSRYVAKPVLNDLLSRENFDPLKPRSANITVLVADMVNYSQTTASLRLESAAQVTRRFLECLTTPVLDLQGTLDRYTGDGLIAFWGAPVEAEDQATRSVEAAREMLKAVKALNLAFQKEGLPRLSVRIGIASGNALVGDFGTPFRAAYTAVGNCINAAARLENKAKELGFEILVSEDVAQNAAASDLLPLGTHDIRGIGPTLLYTIKPAA